MAYFEPYNRLKQCRHGLMLYNVHDLYIGRSLDTYGEYSEAEGDLFRQIVQPGQVVVEAGANIGAHTLVLAQAVGSTGRVLAFEPQRLLFQTLCGNMALNNVTNVHCIHAAVGAQPGEITVPMLDQHRENNFGGLGLGQYEHGERVPLVTLDQLKLSQCHFVKVDVEGMEQEVLEGSRATIERFYPILYVENDRPEKSDNLIRYIDRLGYNMYWHLPPLFNAQNHAGHAENVFGHIVSRNMLCCPKHKPQQIIGLRPVFLPRKRENHEAASNEAS